MMISNITEPPALNLSPRALKPALKLSALSTFIRVVLGSTFSTFCIPLSSLSPMLRANGDPATTKRSGRPRKLSPLPTHRSDFLRPPSLSQWNFFSGSFSSSFCLFSPGPILTQPDLGVARVIKIDLRYCRLYQRPDSPIESRHAPVSIHVLS